MKKGFKITEILSGVTFLVFALCLSAVLLSGRGVHKRLNRSREESYNRRTARQYLSTRVRQSNTVTGEEFRGNPAICFYEEIEGESYITRMYLYDGYIWELFSDVRAELEPDDGEKLFKSSRLDVMIEKDILKVKINGQSLLFSLKEGRQVPG